MDCTQRTDKQTRQTVNIVAKEKASEGGAARDTSRFARPLETLSTSHIPSTSYNISHHAKNRRMGGGDASKRREESVYQ